MVIPLDWGLGHATRCIPLIKELLANNCEVLIAAEKNTQSLLQHEFQQLTFIPLKGYRISYSKTKRWLPLKIIAQVPGILTSIYSEHQWIKKIVKKYSISAIISDNRFGLFHSTVPSVYLTHQLLIKTGDTFTEKIVQKLHYWFIKKYSMCWVPDFEGRDNIAGVLSHPLKKPRDLEYIGGLSRFEKKSSIIKKYDLLLLLSGPEPQRTIFEDLLLAQLKNFKGIFFLVRGLPGVDTKEGGFESELTGSNFFIKNHLSAQELNATIQQSAMVICRSGYTTVMDLIKLNQKAILVPTPGQTEQEYLACYLMKQQFFYSISQQQLDLVDTLKAAADFPFTIPFFDMEQYKKTIRQFVQSL